MDRFNEPDAERSVVIKVMLDKDRLRADLNEAFLIRGKPSGKIYCSLYIPKDYNYGNTT